MSADPPRHDRAWWGLVVGAVVVVVGLALLATALVLGRRTDEPSTAPKPVPASASSRRSLPPVPGPYAAGRRPLPGFGEVAVAVRAQDGTIRIICVLAARSAAQRARGLMEVTDRTLGGYDGMLFLFPDDSESSFWMRNTPMPLSIAYLDADGQVVSTTDMAPCRDRSDCPDYLAGAPFRMALEVPAGRLDDVGVAAGARLSVRGDCPAVPPE